MLTSHTGHLGRPRLQAAVSLRSGYRNGLDWRNVSRVIGRDSHKSEISSDWRFAELEVRSPALLALV